MCVSMLYMAVYYTYLRWCCRVELAVALSRVGGNTCIARRNGKYDHCFPFWDYHTATPGRTDETNFHSNKS
jgi:hypothetical protein